MGWRSTKIAEKLVDYANTTNVEFIVDPRVLFHGWLIFSYLHLRWSSDCQGSVQFGSLTTLWHESMSRQKNSILINKHALNHEPVPLKHCRFSGGVFLLLLCLFLWWWGKGVWEWNRTLFFINQGDEANICNHGGTPYLTQFLGLKIYRV